MAWMEQVHQNYEYRVQSTGQKWGLAAASRPIVISLRQQIIMLLLLLLLNSNSSGKKVSWTRSSGRNQPVHAALVGHCDCERCSQRNLFAYAGLSPYMDEMRSCLTYADAHRSHQHGQQLERLQASEGRCSLIRWNRVHGTSTR